MAGAHAKGRSAIFAPGLLNGRVALVTGGGTGLGRATALELARCGATVTIAGRRAEVLQAAVAAAAEQGVGTIDWASADVRERKDAERVVRGVLESAVAAGHFDTEVLAKYPPSVRAATARSVPLQRLGRPEEHAWLVALLASPLGRVFNGATVTLDGARDNWAGVWPPPGLAD